MRRVAIVVVALGLLAGCRLDTSPITADAGVDVGISHGRCLLVTTTEFRTDGALAVIDADTLEVRTNVSAVHSDAYLRVLEERVFVLNRQGGDSLQELNPTADYRTLSQRSVGRGSNPWGIVLTGPDTAWIALYNDGLLQAVDLAADTNDFLGESVELGAGTDADLRAEPLDLFVHAGVLYVITQGLGDYPHCTETSRGQLSAFDPETGEPVSVFGEESTLALAACNPTSYAVVGDQLWLGHSGSHRVHGNADDDGGVEVIDLESGDSLGLVVNERDLGDRDVITLAANEFGVWIAVAGDDFAASVHRLEGQTPGPSVWESDTGGVFDMELAFGRLWIVDRSVDAPGVVVIDEATGELLAGPLDTGFPPFDAAAAKFATACW